jgi:hypothetical protein
VLEQRKHNKLLLKGLALSVKIVLLPLGRIRTGSVGS